MTSGGGDSKRDPNDYDDPMDFLFYSTLIDKFEPEFCEAADRLGISNEQLREAANSPTPSAFKHLCSHALAHRRGSQLVAMRMPGEQCVSLTELAEREAKVKGNA